MKANVHDVCDNCKKTVKKLHYCSVRAMDVQLCSKCYDQLKNY